MKEPQLRGGGQKETSHLARGMSRWPEATLLTVLGIVYATLLEDLLPGPSFLPIVFVAALVGPLLYAELRGYYNLSRLLGLGLISLATIAIGAIVLNYAAPLGYKPPPHVLFSQAFIIWIANLLTFAVWYWEIDSGGPERRKRSISSYQSEDFLFPQIDQDPSNSANWSPGLLDYIFLAYNQSTAFSPTDTAVLSRRAKILTISQTSISLLIVVVLAARVAS
jgi:hypothetical protein